MSSPRWCRRYIRLRRIEMRLRSCSLGIGVEFAPTIVEQEPVLAGLRNATAPCKEWTIHKSYGLYARSGYYHDKVAK